MPLARKSRRVFLSVLSESWFCKLSSFAMASYPSRLDRMRILCERAAGFRRLAAIRLELIVQA
jgi:hypothetical protein